MKELDKKPLSEKPIGYILAAAGGLLGGPIGIILSLVVIFGLSKIMKEKDGKHPNRFLAWAVIGVIGVPLSLSPLIGRSPNSSESGVESKAPLEKNEEKNKSEALIPLGVSEQVRPDRSLTVTGSEVFSSIATSNQFIDPIESKGGKLVAVFMTIKNSGKESGNMFWTEFQLKDSQDRKYDDLEDFTEVVTLSSWSKERGMTDPGDQLFPGAAAQTVAVFRVAPDAEGLKLVVNEDRYFSID